MCTCQKVQTAKVLDCLNCNENCAWTVDSGATCHICHVEKCFTALYQIKEPSMRWTFSHSYWKRESDLEMILLNGESKSCTFRDVLYVPKLAYNLISMTKASQRGKVVKFIKSACYVLDRNHKIVAKATVTKVGSLY